jgi:hypothetical protein
MECNNLRQGRSTLKWDNYLVEKKSVKGGIHILWSCSREGVSVIHHMEFSRVGALQE